MRNIDEVRDYLRDPIIERECRGDKHFLDNVSLWCTTVQAYAKAALEELEPEDDPTPLHRHRHGELDDWHDDWERDEFGAK